MYADRPRFGAFGSMFRLVNTRHKDVVDLTLLALSAGILLGGSLLGFLRHDDLGCAVSRVVSIASEVKYGEVRREIM